MVIEKSDGLIYEINSDFFHVSAFTETTRFIRLCPGRVVSVQAFFLDPNLVRGVVVCSVSLASSDVAPNSVYYRFFSGLVTTRSVLSYPALGSLGQVSTSLQLVGPSFTAVPTPFTLTLTVPIGLFWRLRGFTVTVVPSAAAGNRYAVLKVTDPISVGTLSFASQTFTIASSTRTYSFRTVPVAEFSVVYPGGTQTFVPISDLVVPGGSTIALFILNAFAGDTISMNDFCCEQILVP